MIRFDCPKCGSALSIPDNFAGRTGQCQNCASSILIPKESTDRRPEASSKAPRPGKAEALPHTSSAASKDKPADAMALEHTGSGVPVFRCSRCAFEKRLPDELLGKKARCPKCGEICAIVNGPPESELIELEDDEPDAFLTAMQSAEDDIDVGAEAISEDLPPIPKTKRKGTTGGPGIPKPRSFLTTALLAGGFFGIAMGLFFSFTKGFGAGILAGLFCGPLFGFVMAFFISGRQVAIRFENRDDFIKDMKRAFKKGEHEVVELADPVFIFKHEQGAAFLCTSHAHVGRREAVMVGPRTYLKKCVRQLSGQYQVDWTRRRLKEDHGQPPADAIAKYAWFAAAALVLLVLWGFKEAFSPEYKAKEYVRSHLKAPSQAKFISTTIVGHDANGTRVEVVFEAPNSFGVMLRDSTSVIVKRDGSVSDY
jgi:hypothetical protein